MSGFTDEHGKPHEDDEATKLTNASKASFKLSLIETVAADPQLEFSDLALIVAHLCFMTWPKRKCWLSTTAARARTGLSERQIATSRIRLIKHKYLVDTEKTKRASRVFIIENPRADEVRDHVALTVENLKEKMAIRQADRRRLAKVVAAASAETEDAMSHAPTECDVPAASAGDSPIYTPQDRALKEEPTSDDVLNVSEGTSAPHLPYPVPETETQLTEALATLFDGCALSPAVLVAMRGMLRTGKLTPAIVEQQRSFAW